MIGLTTGTRRTKLILHELGAGKVTRVTAPGTDGLTTHDVPMPLVKNLLSLHESAAPGSVKGFAKSMFKTGLMEELLTDAIEPLNMAASPSKRIDLKNPERVMEVFYSASFLQNEEAHECLVYSNAGKVVGMAQIGRFAPQIEGLSCTISNLVVSPKLDASSQGVILRHVAQTARERLGEATLITPEPWGDSYATHGFSIERSAAQAAGDPVGASIMRQAGVAPVADKPHVVRCRWSGC